MSVGCQEGGLGHFSEKPCHLGSEGSWEGPEGLAWRLIIEETKKDPLMPMGHMQGLPCSHRPLLWPSHPVLMGTYPTYLEWGVVEGEEAGLGHRCTD